MQTIEYINVNKLRSHPDNPRFIKDDQYEKLCQSLKDNKDYFETRPILCNKDMVIFAGNMRWRAAKEVGMKEVPVAVMDISEDRQRELMIRDNRENGSWNFEMLANEWDKDQLISWGFTDEELVGGIEIETAGAAVGQDSIPEEAPAITAKGDIYRLGDHVLVCGDSTKVDDVEKLMLNNRCPHCGEHN